jgi:hypothetical protein
MHVLDFLPGIRTHVADDPVSALGYPRLLGHPNDEPEEMVALAVLPQVKVVQRRKMFPGNDEYMLRGHRVDVPKSDESLVLQHYLGGDPPIGDPTEKAVVHGT